MPACVRRLLRVDLACGQMRVETIDDAYVRDFVGGSGLGARLLWDEPGLDADPLDPASPLLFLTGPLVGTAAPACGRYGVCARSPQTGLWGEANSGGFWGPELRFAGFDGVLITGRSPEPVTLWLHEGQAELRSAAHLWGQDAYATQAALREEMGDRKVKVACIGKGGENLVRYAAIMNDHGRAAGRTGMGAVMGSKNLKAIAVRGTQEVPLADPEGYRPVARATWDLVKDDISSQLLRAGGTNSYVDWALMSGDLVFNYYGRGTMAEADALGGAALADELLVRARACYRCPIGCGREVRAPRYLDGMVDGPEYETVGAYAALVGSSDLEGAVYASHLCNLYGLDTISAGSTIAFAYYLYNEGVLNRQDTGGLDLQWGKIGPALELTEQIANQEGLGALLAEGSQRMGAELGVEELAVQVKGLEVPMHDPRAFAGLALVYATSPRGACHVAGDLYMVYQGQIVPELGVDGEDPFDQSADTVRLAANSMDWRCTTNALIMCILENPPLENVLNLMYYATGDDWDAERLARLGERAFTLKRAINHRLGMTRADDRLPRLLLEPLRDGETGGFVPDLEAMLEQYYAVRGWDVASARPLPAKLDALDLSFTKSTLWGEDLQGAVERPRI